MTNQPDHPDLLSDYRALKAINRGGNQAAEDKAIAAYIKAYEELGKEEAEKVFFSFFNKNSHGNCK